MYRTRSEEDRIFRGCRSSDSVNIIVFGCPAFGIKLLCSLVKTIYIHVYVGMLSVGGF